jgi:hypothetical protein
MEVELCRRAAHFVVAESNAAESVRRDQPIWIGQPRARMDVRVLTCPKELIPSRNLNKTLASVGEHLDGATSSLRLQQLVARRVKGQHSQWGLSLGKAFGELLKNLRRQH